VLGTGDLRSAQTPFSEAATRPASPHKPGTPRAWLSARGQPVVVPPPANTLIGKNTRVIASAPSSFCDAPGHSVASEGLGYGSGHLSSPRPGAVRAAVGRPGTSGSVSGVRPGTAGYTPIGRPGTSGDGNRPGSTRHVARQRPHTHHSARAAHTPPTAKGWGVPGSLPAAGTDKDSEDLGDAPLPPPPLERALAVSAEAAPMSEVSNHRVSFFSPQKVPKPRTWRRRSPPAAQKLSAKQVGGAHTWGWAPALPPGSFVAPPAESDSDGASLLPDNVVAMLDSPVMEQRSGSRSPRPPTFGKDETVAAWSGGGGEDDAGEDDGTSVAASVTRQIQENDRQSVDRSADSPQAGAATQLDSDAEEDEGERVASVLLRPASRSPAPRLDKEEKQKQKQLKGERRTKRQAALQEKKRLQEQEREMRARERHRLEAAEAALREQQAAQAQKEAYEARQRELANQERLRQEQEALRVQQELEREEHSRMLQEERRREREAEAVAQEEDRRAAEEAVRLQAQEEKRLRRQGEETASSFRNRDVLARQRDGRKVPFSLMRDDSTSDNNKILYVRVPLPSDAAPCSGAPTPVPSSAAFLPPSRPPSTSTRTTPVPLLLRPGGADAGGQRPNLNASFSLVCGEVDVEDLVGAAWGSALQPAREPAVPIVEFPRNPAFGAGNCKRSATRAHVAQDRRHAVDPNPRLPSEHIISAHMIRSRSPNYSPDVSPPRTARSPPRSANQWTANPSLPIAPHPLSARTGTSAPSAYYGEGKGARGVEGVVQILQKKNRANCLTSPVSRLSFPGSRADTAEPMLSEAASTNPVRWSGGFLYKEWDRAGGNVSPLSDSNFSQETFGSKTSQGVPKLSLEQLRKHRVALALTSEENY